MTDGMLLREAMADPLLEQRAAVIRDDPHERALSGGFGFAWQGVAVQRHDLKLVVMCATPTQAHQASFNSAADEVPGLRTVETPARPSPSRDYREAALRTLVQACVPEGASSHPSGEHQIEDTVRPTKADLKIVGDHGARSTCSRYARRCRGPPAPILEAPPPSCRAPARRKDVWASSAETSLTKTDRQPGRPRPGNGCTFPTTLQGRVAAGLTDLEGVRRPARGRAGQTASRRLYTTAFTWELKEQTYPGAPPLPTWVWWRSSSRSPAVQRPLAPLRDPGPAGRAAEARRRPRHFDFWTRPRPRRSCARSSCSTTWARSTTTAT